MPSKNAPKEMGRPAFDVSRDTLGGKIRAARKTAKLSAIALSEKIGIKHQSLTAIERNEVQAEKRTLILLAQELKNDFGDPTLREYIKDESELSIPITARVAAGDAVEFFLEGEDTDSITIDPRMIRKKGKHFALRVAGDSMEGAHVLSGDIVIVRYVPKTYEPRPDDLVVADIRAEGITLKKWKKAKDEVILSPTTEGYQEIRRPAWRVKPVAVVVGVIRMA